MTPSVPQAVAGRPLFVLVGGWPGSGKSTLARGLAGRLGLALLVKDEVKEALADVLGRPDDVPASQQLGRAAARAVLVVAARCPGAVLDSTWFAPTRPLVRALPGDVVEVRCVLDREVARERYLYRAPDRHPGHLDLQRSPDELWGAPVPPLGVGPLVEVDTGGPVDLAAVVHRIRQAVDRPSDER